MMAGERAHDTATSTRKLQIVGGSTFAVTLPKAWVERLGLASGDELRLSRRPGGELVVEPARDTNAERRELVVRTETTDSDHLLRIVTAMYVSGFRLLRLQIPGGVGPWARRAVNEACERLKGLQLVEEGDEELILQDLEDAHELDMTRSLAMMHRHVQRMLRHAGGLIQGTVEREEVSWELCQCEAELDRLLLLLIKHHNIELRDLSYGLGGGFGPDQSLYVVLAAQYLERIGDYVERVVEAATVAGPLDTSPHHANLPDRLDEVATILGRAFEAFMEGSEGKANTTAEDAAAFARRMHEASREVISAPQVEEAGDTKTFLEIATIMGAIERVALYAKSLSEFSMDKALAVHLDGPPGGKLPSRDTYVRKLKPGSNRSA